MDIVFCSLSDRPVFSTPMFQHLEEYCVKNNYKCVLEYKSLCDERAPSWSKIPLLQREMKKNQDIPYIVWIDDDIIITNKNVRFEDLIKPYDFKNILLSEEIYPPFNCGIIVCKNNDETFNYLTHIWNLCEKYPEYKKRANWEQEIFQRDYQTNKKHITTIPYRIIQTFYRKQNPDWKPSDFSAHITGMSMELRIQMRNDILKIIQ